MSVLIQGKAEQRTTISTDTTKAKNNEETQPQNAATTTIVYETSQRDSRELSKRDQGRRH